MQARALEITDKVRTTAEEAAAVAPEAEAAARTEVRAAAEAEAPAEDRANLAALRRQNLQRKTQSLLRAQAPRPKFNLPSKIR